MTPQIMEGDRFKFLKDKDFIFGLLGGAAIVAALCFLIWGIINISGTKTDTNIVGITAKPLELAPVANSAITTFSLKKDATICRQAGKPAVYLFSASWCPHCQWVKDIYDAVVKDYVKADKIVAYHYDVETGDDLLTPATETALPAEAQKVYSYFNPDDSIPTFVFGCKYFRVGNGHETENDAVAETNEFRAVIDDLLKTN